jgi:dTDP-4-amino-4,6-dideoxygalactose transaminase
MSATHVLPASGRIPPRDSEKRSDHRSWLRRVPPVHSPLSFRALRDAVSDVVHDDARLRLAKELCRMYHADEALLVDSGTHALQLAISLAEKITHGPNLVALPAYSCFDIATAAVGAGARIMLYDVDPDTLAPDMESFAATMSSGATVAVVAPLYGVPVDWRAIENCATQFGALVIEDAAQGFGSSQHGKSLGSHGRLSVLSFSRGKGWTGGCGGALLVRGGALDMLGHHHHEFVPAASPALGGLLHAAAQWAAGRPSLYALPAALPWLHLGQTLYHEPAPVRDMPRVAAGLLERSLPLAIRESGIRRRMADEYLRDLASVDRMKFTRRVRFVHPAEGSTPGYLRFPLRLSHRIAGIPDVGRAEWLGMARGYPSTIGDLRAVRRRLHTIRGADRWPGAETLVRELVTLPTHSYVEREDRDELTSLVRAYHR